MLRALLVACRCPTKVLPPSSTQRTQTRRPQARNLWAPHAQFSRASVAWHLRKMPWLDVYALDKHLCRIKTEPGWTGRELKEAIEEETGWDYLVCTQQLAVGTTLITHDVQLDSVLTGDADASMTRLPEPANIQAFTGDRKALGLAMRPLEIFPIVAMELPPHALLFDASTWQQWDATGFLLKVII